MKAYSFLAAAAFLLAIPCFSANAADGTDAMPFVRVNHDPISTAMGGACIVNPSAYSSFSNTAALVFCDNKFDVAANYQNWNGCNTQNRTAAAGRQFGNFGVLVGAYYGMEDKMAGYDSNGASTGTFRPSNLQINAGVAWKFVPFLAIGLDIKYLNYSADGDSNSAVAFDAFLQTKLSDFRIAAGVSSVGTTIKSETGYKYSLPTSITVAGGYDHKFGKHGLNVALDIDYYLEHSDTVVIGGGAEYSYNDMAFVRAGYHYADAATVVPSYFSAGVGFKIIGLHIDFSYQVMTDNKSPLKDCFTVGLAYGF